MVTIKTNSLRFSSHRNDILTMMTNEDFKRERPEKCTMIGGCRCISRS